MQHENTLSTQTKIDQIQEKLKRIENAKLRVSIKKLKAEKRLHKLKEKYPRMLARKALKQSTSGEILAIKRKIVGLEDLLTDFPLALQGLDELERSIRNEIVEDQNEVDSILFASIENV
jgi:hypothetical protein